MAARSHGGDPPGRAEPRHRLPARAGGAAMSGDKPEYMSGLYDQVMKKRNGAARRGTAYGRLVVLTVDDTDTAPPRDYLLKGLLSPAEISLWVGPPKCGKSFLL